MGEREVYAQRGVCTMGEREVYAQRVYLGVYLRVYLGGIPTLPTMLPYVPPGVHHPVYTLLYHSGYTIPPYPAMLHGYVATAVLGGEVLGSTGRIIKEREALGSLRTLRVLTVVMSLCAELLASSRVNNVKDWIAIG